MSVTEWIDGVLMDRKKKCRFGGHVQEWMGFFWGDDTLFCDGVFSSSVILVRGTHTHGRDTYIGSSSSCRSSNSRFVGIGRCF